MGKHNINEEFIEIYKPLSKDSEISVTLEELSATDIINASRYIIDKGYIDNNEKYFIKIKIDKVGIYVLTLYEDNRIRGGRLFKIVNPFDPNSKNSKVF